MFAEPKITYHFKFERTQHPVGHGGFHTGQAVSDETAASKLHYFFDCGSKEAEKSPAKSAMLSKLAASEFDFGVISHFDSDHVKDISNVKQVGIVYIPYTTKSDLLYQFFLDVEESSFNIEGAVEAFNRFVEWKKRANVVVIMVKHGLPAGDNEGRPVITQGLILLNDVPVRPDMPDYVDRIASDLHPVELWRYGNPLIRIKFFNSYRDEVSISFCTELDNAVKAGKLIAASGAAYASTATFLKDLEDPLVNTTVVQRNRAVLKKFYVDLLQGNAPKALLSNLSSLCVHAETVGHRHHNLERNFVKPDKFSRWSGANHDGWMLTGDLELTAPVWEQFGLHYALEIERTVVFNVPHHGSRIAFNHESMNKLGKKLYVFPVKSNDELHPSRDLRKDMVKTGAIGKLKGRDQSFICVDSDVGNYLTLTTLVH